MTSNLCFSAVFAEEIREAFQTAERHLKSVELLGEGQLVPATNELRYAGQHLTLAICETDEKVAEEHCQKVIRHCQRSSYDSLEMRVQFYIGECDDFRDDYKETVIDSSILPTYAADRQNVRTIKSEIEAMTRDSENRNEFWETMERHADVLSEICNRWEDARPELNKKVQNERKWYRITLLGILIALATLAVSVWR